MSSFPSLFIFALPILLILVIISWFKRNKNINLTLIILTIFYLDLGLIFFNSSSGFTLAASATSFLIAVILFIKINIMKDPEKINKLPEFLKLVFSDLKRIRGSIFFFTIMIFLFIGLQVTIGESTNVVSVENKIDKNSENTYSNERAMVNENTSSESIEDNSSINKTSSENVNDGITSEITSIVENNNEKVSDIFFDPEGIIISMSAGDSFSETKSFKDFSKIGTQLLKYLSREDFQNIILVKNEKFLDEKGNQFEEVAFSSIHTLKNIKEIDFNNWESQVFVDPYRYFDIADGYFINLTIYSNIKEDYLGNLSPGKTNDNKIYNQYGY